MPDAGWCGNLINAWLMNKTPGGPSEWLMDKTADVWGLIYFTCKDDYIGEKYKDYPVIVVLEGEAF